MPAKREGEREDKCKIERRVSGIFLKHKFVPSRVFAGLVQFFSCVPYAPSKIGLRDGTTALGWTRSHERAQVE